MSGTYIATITMLVVPLLANMGLSQACANEVVAIGAPFATAAVLLVWRYFKGGVTAYGKRV